MLHQSDTLWHLTTRRPRIDAGELSCALEREVEQDSLDVRTRLLVRDAMDALHRHWGPDRLEQWLGRSAHGLELRQIWKSDLGAARFPSLAGRIMNATQPDLVRQFLRDLGSQVDQPLRIEIGGSISLILQGALSRATEDIDLVDEVPAGIRDRHDLLDQLSQRYGLRIAHFQSHYLPTGWQSRVRSIGRFGNLDVFLVDPYDIFIGKLFSAREKDLDDLRELHPQLDLNIVRQRLLNSAGRLLANDALAQNAKKNWYVLYGEPLPQPTD